jgi:hypothetical protein
MGACPIWAGFFVYLDSLHVFSKWGFRKTVRDFADGVWRIASEAVDDAAKGASKFLKGLFSP